MTKPIFVRPNDDYDSYRDYYSLIELCGFDLRKEAEVDFSDPDAVFILNMQNLDYRVETGGWPNAKAHLIYYELEWNLSYRDRIPGIAEWWTMDRWYAERNGYTFVPLGSHPELIKVNPVIRNHAAEYDICFMAYMGPYRRDKIAAQFRAAGISIAPNAWGEERRNIIERSRVMVHVHQHDEYPTVAAQRFALAASATIPVVSEVINDAAPLEVNVDYISADYGSLVQTVRNVLDEGIGDAHAANMYHKLCHEYRFGKSVMEALKVRV